MDARIHFPAHDVGGCEVFMEMSRRAFSLSFLAALACRTAPAGSPTPVEPAIAGLDPESVTAITRTDAEWRAALDPQAYRVLREKGTEMAYTGAYWNLHDAGTYACRGCGLNLFRSTDKFDSGTGWPSYTRPIAADRVREVVDTSHGMVRVEIVCMRCGGHLGHKFDDGPEPTGMRYCMNSVSMVFRPEAGKVQSPG
jgi:peptide-methionine (R)-S-oxide reductase